MISDRILPTGWGHEQRAEIRLGDWRDTLRGERFDHIITDPPYGARTHNDESLAKQVCDATGQATRRRINYDAWTQLDVFEFIEAFAPRVNGWFVCFCSHDLIPAYEAAYEAAGLYHFAPVGFVEKRPRLIGDGPPNWLCYVMIARPKRRPWSAWTKCAGVKLPGIYPRDFMDTGKGYSERKPIVGGKPVRGMRDLVRDYSLPGDLVADPFSGAGTTIAAAALEGRRGIGSEIDPEHHAIAVSRTNGLGGNEKTGQGNLFI